MRELNSYHSSQTLSAPTASGYSYHQFYTSNHFCNSQTSYTTTKLVHLLRQFMQGLKNPSEIFSAPSQQKTLRKQSSIENLAQFEIEQPAINSPSISLLRSERSIFQIDREVVCLGSRLSIYSEIPNEPIESFNCSTELRESDISDLFSDGDFKIMVLAVALLCKYLHVTGGKPSANNVSALFFTGVIIGFKLAYDNELPGLMAEISRLSQISVATLERMESAFLRAVDYDLGVDGGPIKTVMMWLI